VGTIVAYLDAGLIVKRRWSRGFTVAYGEILTAERLRWRWGMRLHLRTRDTLRVSGWRGTAVIEGELRRRGVRVVDCWGAIIAPTLADFEEELARTPVGVRQSSDNA
jgi:hypothetical protein